MSLIFGIIGIVCCLGSEFGWATFWMFLAWACS
jgi:hypothetical protein